MSRWWMRGRPPGVRLFFAAADGGSVTGGLDLWASNGTQAGTVLIKRLCSNVSDGIVGAGHMSSRGMVALGPN